MAGGAASLPAVTPTLVSAGRGGAAFTVTGVPASCPAPGDPLPPRDTPQARAAPISEPIANGRDHLM